MNPPTAHAAVEHLPKRCAEIEALDITTGKTTSRLREGKRVYTIEMCPVCGRTEDDTYSDCDYCEVQGGGFIAVQVWPAPGAAAALIELRRMLSEQSTDKETR